jgi:uncharacterized protein YqhQ
MQISEKKHVTTVGGQALIEGLMMMGPKNTSIAVRKPDGEIIVKNQPPVKKSVLAKIPVIRGSYLLIKQLIVGVGALMFSAEFFDIEEADAKPSKLDKFLDKIFGDKLKEAVIVFSVILSLFLSVGLFMILPNIIATIAMFPFDEQARATISWEIFKLNKPNFAHGIAYNFIEGVIRIVIFFVYIVLAAKISPEIKRVWQYHGAEHKTIHCYENGEELTVENIRKYTPLHPRCGTSFLFTVMIVSILIFSFTGWHSILVNILIRLSLVPLVAGISYELFKAVGKSNNSIVNIFKAPGLMFQKFTTAEPDDKMIEVAIVAMENALTENKEDDKW